MIFPGIPFTSRGRYYIDILRKAASILTDAIVLYTKPMYCCKIQGIWELPDLGRKKGAQDSRQRRLGKAFKIIVTKGTISREYPVQ
jgi:hypothetical protein